MINRGDETVELLEIVALREEYFLFIELKLELTTTVDGATLSVTTLGKTKEVLFGFLTLEITFLHFFLSLLFLFFRLFDLFLLLFLC